MNYEEQCFGCHGLYDVDDDIASSRRSTLDALAQDPEVEKSDVSSIYLTIASISQTTPNAQPTT